MASRLIVFALLMLVATVAADGWYLLKDEKNVVPQTTGWNLSKVMPVAQNYTSVLQKQTVMVIGCFDVPADLMCTSVAFDQPFYRRFPQGNPALATTPGNTYFSLWTGSDPPSGDSLAISLNATESWKMSTPSDNGTWAPARSFGIYRFQHTLQAALASSTRYYFGVYVEQPNFGNTQNTMYWVASANGTQPFSYIDVFGNYLVNTAWAQPQMAVTLAPTATLYYANISLTYVATTVWANCTSNVSDPNGTIVYPALPAPSFNAIVDYPTYLQNLPTLTATPTSASPSTTLAPTPPPSSTIPSTPSPGVTPSALSPPLSTPATPPTSSIQPSSSTQLVSPSPAPPTVIAVSNSTPTLVPQPLPTPSPAAFDAFMSSGSTLIIVGASALAAALVCIGISCGVCIIARKRYRDSQRQGLEPHHEKFQDLDDRHAIELDETGGVEDEDAEDDDDESEGTTAKLVVTSSTLTEVDSKTAASVLQTSTIV
jgi:hypothetical protein